MSAVIRYLPTAGITPLPRKANVGRLPKGVIRFSAFKRAREADRIAAATEARRESEYDMASSARRQRMAELVYLRSVRLGIADTFKEAFERVGNAIESMHTDMRRDRLNRMTDPDGAA